VETDAEELVRIPMGRPLPDRGRVIGMGAAGGLVHPATGYSVAASLRAARRLGPALADAVLVRGTTPSALAELGHRAVWPAPAERARALYSFGLEAVLGFDQGECRAFFDAFFDLPEPRWRGYLAGTDGPGEVARTMRALFAAVPPPLRRKLARGNPLALRAALR
jgi:lycopene beta-cyclase